MPSKRRPDKNKRYRANKAERQARAARSANAGEATARAQNPGGSTASDAGDARASSVTGSSRTGGTRPAQTAAERRAERRSRLSQYPGQRAVFLAFLFTLVSAVTLLVAPIQVQREVPVGEDVPADVDPDDVETDDDGTATYTESAMLLDEEGPAVAAGVIAVPIAITAGAVWFTKRPQRSNAWTMAMMLLAAYIFLFAGPYGIITLPAMIALAVGGFQSRRAENKIRMAQIAAERAARIEAGEVDDVDERDGTGRSSRRGRGRGRRGEVIDTTATEVDAAGDGDTDGEGRDRG